MPVLVSTPRSPSAVVVPSGPAPFQPTDVGGCVLWLPSSAYSIAAGTITGADKSGHHNDCSEAATAITIQPAAGGLPGYLNYPGAGNQTISGVFGSTIVTGAYTLLVSWLTPIATNAFQLFDIASHFKLDHDGSGGGRTYVAQGGFLIDNGDTLVAAHVTTVTASDTPSPTGILYRDGVVEASGALGLLGSFNTYLIGGTNQFSGTSDARRIFKTVLFDNVVSAANQARLEAYMLTPGD